MSFWRRPVSAAGRAALFLACCGLLRAHGVEGAPAETRVTRVIRDVKLQPGGAAALKAALTDGATVRTGAKSRAELTSTDQAVARLGANTTVAVGGPVRLRLNEGSILFQTPPSAQGAKVGSGVITVATHGSTGIIERHLGAYVKVLVLEGTARAYLPRIGESVLVTAGQMLITKPDAKSLPEAVHFDIGQLYKTSLLTNPDFAPLARRGEIARAIEKQKRDPDFIRTNLVIFGRGTLVNLVEPAPVEPREQAAAARADAKAKAQ